MKDQSLEDGLGPKAAGPDFQWPAVPAGTARDNPSAAQPTRSTLSDPPPADPAVSLAELNRRHAGPARRAAGYPQADGHYRALRRRASALLLVLILLFVAGRIVVGVAGKRSTPVPERSTPTRTIPTEELAADWLVEPSSLRSDVTKPEFTPAMDGTFDGVRAIDAGSAWLVLTGDEHDQQLRLHALLPATGRELWQRPLANGLCAPALLKRSVLCAYSTGTDPATGLGTSWRLLLLDPATGVERRAADFEGWLTLLHVQGDRVLLVEQRQPAPDAELTVLDAGLTQLWHQDLREQSQHDGMFSDNRIYSRNLPIPAGPALDRPRIRTVANGLTALWVGQTTAFVDLAEPALVGMPRCSRLVDDGKRLWCNQGDLAAGLSYRIKPLYETDLGTRLAFPYRDPRAGDVTDPVFLTREGKAVRVDLTTGRTTGPLVDTRNGSAFGLVTSPSAAYVAGVTLIGDSDTTFAVNARTGAVHWQRDDLRAPNDVLEWNGKLLLAEGHLFVLDPATGSTASSYRQTHGLYTQALGAVLIGTGPDELARLADP